MNVGLKLCVVFLLMTFAVGCPGNSRGFPAVPGVCFIYHPDKLDFEGATAYCKDLGGILIEILDDARHSIVSQMTDQQIWMGLRRDDDPNSPWVWQGSGLALTDTNSYWRNRQPNKANKACVNTFKKDQNVWADQRCSTKRSFICETMDAAKLDITGCSSYDYGTWEGLQYDCTKAFDGVMEPGNGNAWSSGDIAIPGTWIRLELGTSVYVSKLTLWWACSVREQWSQVTVSFGDGRVNLLSHTCTTETSWLGCSSTSDPGEDFIISPPAMTTYVLITGVTTCTSDDFWWLGFREIEVFGIEGFAFPPPV